MFDKNTVFVTGAGASWHYGYPTGEDLVAEVITKLQQTGDMARIVADSSSVWPDDVPNLVAMQPASSTSNPRQLRERWRNFWLACTDLAERLQAARPPVIDYFIGWNPEHEDIGRTMIAWVIRERQSNDVAGRANINRTARREAGPYKDDWHRWILYKLTSGFSDPRELLKNKVTFITFNYDNSLEYHLYQGLHAYTKFRPYLKEFFEICPVLHVYGCIGERGASAPGSIPSVPDEIDPTSGVAGLMQWVTILDHAFQSGKNLKIIDPHTKGDNREVIAKAREALGKAETAYILGYGFDENNSERIGLEQLSNKYPREKKRSVMFTNFGGSDRVTKRASKLFLGGPGLLLPPKIPINESYDKLYVEMSTRDVYGAFEHDFEE